MGIVTKLHFKQDSPFVQAIIGLFHPSIENVTWIAPPKLHITLIHLMDKYRDSRSNYSLSDEEATAREQFIAEFKKMVNNEVDNFNTECHNPIIQNARVSSGQKNTHLRIDFDTPEVEKLQERIRNNTAHLLRKYPNTEFHISPNIQLHISIATLVPDSNAAAIVAQTPSVSDLNSQTMEFARIEIAGLEYGGLGQDQDTAKEPGATQPYAQPRLLSQGANGMCQPFFRKQNQQVIFMQGLRTKNEVIAGIQQFGAAEANTAFIFATNIYHHKPKGKQNKSVIGNSRFNKASAITVTRENGGMAELAYALQQETSVQIGGIPNTALDLLDPSENRVLFVLAAMQQIDAWLAEKPDRYIILPVREHRNQDYFTGPCFDKFEPSWYGRCNRTKDLVTAFLIRLYFTEKAGLTISRSEGLERDLLIAKEKRGITSKAGLPPSEALDDDDWVERGAESSSSSSYQPANLSRDRGVMSNSSFFSHSAKSSGSSFSGRSNSPMPAKADNDVPFSYTCRGCNPKNYQDITLKENEIIYSADNDTQIISYKCIFKRKEAALSISAAELGVGGVTREYVEAIKAKLEAKVNANTPGFVEIETLRTYIRQREKKGYSIFDTAMGGVAGPTKVRVAQAILNHVEGKGPLTELSLEDKKALNQPGSDLQKAIVALGEALGRNFVAEIEQLYVRNQP